MNEELVKLPCCGYYDASAVKWNSFNKAVQCHNCGQLYAALTAQQEPVAMVEVKAALGATSWRKPARDYYEAPPSGVREGLLTICRKSKLFAQFLAQKFWHAHHVDLVWRMDGKDIHEQADWLKDLWHALRAEAERVEPHVMVPVEPTPKMVEAGSDEVIAPIPTAGRRAIAVYKAMLRAAQEGKS